jgi:hypothetical protein
LLMFVKTTNLVLVNVEQLLNGLND